MRTSLTKLLSLTLLCAVPAVSWAGDDNPAKSAKAPEEVILDKIDQLQKQLNELRGELTALRTSRSAVSAAPRAGAPEEVLMDRIDQLQKQLKDLRGHPTTLRPPRSAAPPAPAPAAPAPEV